MTPLTDELFHSLPDRGWLSRPEAELLWAWLHKVGGDVLEVGCYQGRSTCLLAASGRTVHAVDPFLDGFDSTVSGDSLYLSFQENLRDRRINHSVLGVWDDGAGVKLTMYDGANLVCVYRERVEDWQRRTCPFAYLDGDHTFEGTAEQLKAAFACGAEIIAVHDVNDSGEGAAIKRACLRVLGVWDDRVERLAVWDLRKEAVKEAL